MPQLTVTQNAIVAQPGMAFDAEASSRDVVSAIAAVNIPFGVLCELTGGAAGTAKTAQPVQSANLTGTVTVTNASTAITFTVAQTLPQGQALVFSDQPGVVYYLAAAMAAATVGVLTATYSGTGGAAKLAKTSPYSPQLIGISIFDPMGVEQNYVQWGLPTVLAGTVSVTNGSANVTFSVAQTLAQGQPIVFSSQPGVQYFLSAAVVASTAGTLTASYVGVTAGAATSTLAAQGSNTVGWKAGTSVPFMRRGRIWAASDAAAGATQTGPINTWHSSTGANPQGVFTFTTAASLAAMTAGTEIDVAPSCFAFNPGLGFSAVQNDPFGNQFRVTPVEINA